MTVSKIGILGGSFDPVHKGHVDLARAAWQELRLDRIYFVPARQSPFKQNAPLAKQHRLAMLRLALAKQPWARICHFELRRAGPSYSVETIDYFKNRFPSAQLFLILGQDAARDFLHWKAARRIAANCVLVVGLRPDQADRSNKKLHLAHTVLKKKLPDVSSSKVRLGADRRWLDRRVIQYMRQNNLYNTFKT